MGKGRYRSLNCASSRSISLLVFTFVSDPPCWGFGREVAVRCFSSSMSGSAGVYLNAKSRFVNVTLYSKREKLENYPGAICIRVCVGLPGRLVLGSIEEPITRGEIQRRSWICVSLQGTRVTGGLQFIEACLWLGLVTTISF